MDDELEDELAYDIFWAHVKIVSNLAGHLGTMSESFSFYVWLYMFRPGTVAAVLALVAAILLCQSTDIWFHLFMKRLRYALSHYSSGENIKLLVNPSSPHDRRALEYQGKYASVYALQGRRPRMEDRFNILEDEEQDVHLYGVFDGHGGEFSAEYAEKHLFSNLLKKLVAAKQKMTKVADDSSSDLEASDDSRQQNATNNNDTLLSEFSKIISEEILSLDASLLDIAKASRDLSGSTALVALIHGNDVLVANVGDSRGVMCDNKGMAIPLSFDHKPQQLKEHRRIKEAGGFITFSGVWRVAGVLATSRALGDFPLKERQLLVAQPDILSFRVENGTSGLVLATDGLWDALSNEEAAGFVSKHLDEPYHGARSLVHRAYNAGSQDNICALVVDLRSRGTLKNT
ncbi:protein phosphatase 1L-like [Ornithodoros turicata]